MTNKSPAITVVDSSDKLVLATRLHSQNSQYQPDYNQLYEWCEGKLRLLDHIIVAVDQNLLTATEKHLASLDGVTVLLVAPWGVTQALNSLLHEAQSMGANRILFLSREVTFAATTLAKLNQELDEQSLVVGARMTSEHGKRSGEQSLYANNCPWNTCALWSVPLLGLTGFPVIGSGRQDIAAGMEELVAISLIQHLYKNCVAKLVDTPDLQWDTGWHDEQRVAWHQEKMASKRLRAEAQLKAMSLPRGRVVVESAGLDGDNPDIDQSSQVI